MSDPVKPEYPKRPAYWAHKLIRLMFRTCAAQDIGTEGLTLVALIAHTEDAKRYSGAVTFWNDQLLSIMGFKSWGQLDRARDKAISGGWLHYENGGKRKVGRYWTTIPPELVDIPDSDVSCDSHAIITNNGDNDVIETGYRRDRTVIEPRENRGRSGEHSSLLPLPLTSPGPKERPARKRAVFVDTPDFVTFWEAYPRKENKGAARQAFAKAILRAPPGDILEAAKAFAASPKGKGDYCPHASTWLNQERWTDDPKEWSKVAAVNGKRMLPIGPGQTYDPEAGKNDPNYGKM